MTNQFGPLDIKRMAIHRVFQKEVGVTQQTPPIYNQELTILDPDGVRVMKDRITNALGEQSMSLEVDVNDVSPGSMFDIVSRIIECDKDEVFLQLSNDVAKRLDEAQTSAVMPGGVVVVIDGTAGVSQKKFVCIIKAETDGGFSLNETDQKLTMMYISQLLLTKQQRLYKIGIFIDKKESPDEVKREAKDFSVYVYDHLMKSRSNGDAARYFMVAFLGCRPKSNAKQLTKDFYQYTKNFIDDMNIPVEQKVDLNNALYSYLKTNQEQLIHVETFAETFLGEDFIDEFCSYMDEKKIPSTAIQKDISLIAGTLKRRRLKFSSNVTITAPSDDFADKVKVMGYTEDDQTILHIKGTIKEQA